MKKISLILIIIIIIAGTWYFGKGYFVSVPASENAGETSVTETGMMFAKLGGNAVYVVDQRYEKTMIVNIAYLERPGFVVLHETTADEKPGKVVGFSKLLSETENKNVEIVITDHKTSSAPKMLLAMLHEDNGDGIFQESDPALKDVSGNPVWMVFSIDDKAGDPKEIEIMF